MQALTGGIFTAGTLLVREKPTRERNLLAHPTLDMYLPLSKFVENMGLQCVYSQGGHGNCIRYLRYGAVR